MNRHSQSVAQFFDGFASTYDRAIRAISYFMPDFLNTRLSQLDVAPRVILDAACGTGLAGKILKQRFPSATLYGCDISAKMLAQAAQKGVYDQLQVGNLDDPLDQYSDGQFDLVVCLGAVEFLESPEQAMSELFRVLRAGGVACVSFEEFAENDAGKPRRTQANEQVQGCAYSIAESTSMLEHCGFAIHEVDSETAYVSSGGFACPYAVYTVMRPRS